MNAERYARESGKVRAVFCLVLIAALLCGVFAVNGFAAGAGPADFDVKVDSCTTHTAAVSDGDLYMWGTNDYGQFPNCDLTYSVKPVKVAEDVADVAVSDSRTLVVYNDGSLYMYGRDPLTGKNNLNTRIASGAAQVSCSDSFGLYLAKSGALMAWGSNENGQLGVSGKAASSTPVKVMEGVTKAVAGEDFSLALDQDGTLYGWGSNAFQQLNLQEGDTIPEVAETPVQVTDQVKDMDAGNGYSCILKENGTLYSCGLNTSNQTGVRSLDDTLPLTKVMDNVRSVAAGDTHGFAVGKNGTVYSWGYGLSGELGGGQRDYSVGASASDLDFVEIFAGDGTSFGVSSDGSLWAWGANTNRLLCTNSGVDAYEPVKVLNADMSWAFNEQEVPDEPQHNAPGGAAANDPIVVKTPFISGYGLGHFMPEKNVTRAEFLCMVVNALTDFDAEADYRGTSTFDDVDASRWYAPYVFYAQKHDIIAGYVDNTCKPDNPITRAEAANITYRALKRLTSNATQSSFKDVDSSIGWAIPAIEALSEREILSGYEDGTFRPNQLITRAEAVKIVSACAFDPTTEEAQEKIAKATNAFLDVAEAKWYYPYVLYAAGKLS